VSLDRDTIVHAALDLLNDVGLDDFTTRRLAERLGVRQPAIYWHFRSKRDLLDAMAAHMMPEYRPSSGIADEDWKEEWMDALKADARFFRDSLLRYRDGARVHAGTRPDPGVFATLERRIRAMCEAGFSADDALNAMMVIGHYVVGSVIEQQSSAEAARAQTGAGFTTDPEEFPSLSLGISLAENGDPTTGFEFGLDALVKGIATRKGVARGAAVEHSETKQASHQQQDCNS
jgi:TetR/AcrR family tetracycline transcriptional repressor